MKIEIKAEFEVPDTGGHYPTEPTYRPALLENTHTLLRQGLEGALLRKLNAVAEPNPNPAVQAEILSWATADIAMWSAFLAAARVTVA